MDLFWECNRDLPCVSNLHALRRRYPCCICLVHGYDAGDVTRAHAQARASGAARQLEPNSDMLHMCDESVQCRQCDGRSWQGRRFRVIKHGINDGRRKYDMLHMCDECVQCRQCHGRSCQGRIFRVSKAAGI